MVALVTFAGFGEASAGEQCGKAAWFDLDSQTASGEMADGSTLTAAHRDLPFQTRVRVENLANGRTVVVRINDRGPFGKGRIIDVSRAAAEKLGFINDGITRVRVSMVDGDPSALSDSCGSIKTVARAAVVQVSNNSDVPAPRPRPESEADTAVTVVAVTEVEILPERFDDAFAPTATPRPLSESLQEKAEAKPPPPVFDPHQAMARREDWDRLQQLPE
ncbi:MAG: septal ring lytic transglycosylase RlpA family protein [Hyphomicrobiales bacterium]|nr:septal ring lytic transglycosylase RlpA family protein [Hyphomicrobiales bacterium]